jgi:non-ribosomal peptide synthetase component F
MLGEVDEPTAPFGLLDTQGDGSAIVEARIELTTTLALRLRERARALGVSAASLCHLAWAQVLGRVSGRADVVFGTVLFGRMQGGKGTDRGLGLFVNTLPIRIQVGAESVERNVRQTHALLAELMRHEHAPLALAQRCSAVAAPTPLFGSLLNYTHSQSEVMRTSEAASLWISIDTFDTGERTNYPLALAIDDTDDGFALKAQAASSIVPGRVCEFMRTALERLVDALESAPDTETRTIDVLPDAERRLALEEWNATEAHYPRETTVQELFEAQVEKGSDAVALEHGELTVSYAELNARANRLARRLRDLGVGPNSLVAICMERGVEMVVALLATLKAGGAYAPLDPAYPPDRLIYMLEDSAPVVLLTHDAAVAALAGYSSAVPILNLDSDAPQWAAQPPYNPDRAGIGLGARSLAYVIYTSGSTGLPKGVMVEHRSLVNLICWHREAFRLGPGKALFLRGRVRIRRLGLGDLADAVRIGHAADTSSQDCARPRELAGLVGGAGDGREFSADANGRTGF